MKTNTVVMKALNSLIEEHLAAMEVRHYSANTLRTRRFLLRAFTQWCGSREIRVTVQFRKKDVEDYQAHLHTYCKHTRATDRTCNRLAIRGQQMRLSAVRVFLAWLTKTGVLATNPAAEVETLREDHRLPRQILTAPEVEKVLDGINTRSLTGLRDRAILETLYSTGMRRSELLALTVHDISLESGVVRINNGKGARDRVVPIGQR
jgi:integrase/recombinase XerD